MFGKLLKYDLRSMLKEFLPLWPAVLAIALVNRLLIGGSVVPPQFINTAVFIAALVYVSILMAMSVLSLIFVIRRFYRGLLGDEGYLMHTLPVKTWQLVGTKLLCALIVTIINALVAMVSILIIGSLARSDLVSGLKYIFDLFSIACQKIGLNAPLFLFELLLLGLVGLASGYLMIYLSMAIGHLFHKNRVAMSVVAFVVINSLVNSLSNGLFDLWSGAIPLDLTSFAEWTQFHLSMALTVAFYLAGGTVYFLATNYILRRRLNLE